MAGATVLILNPRDSSVITYGVSDDRGRFRILCDRKEVPAKISCLGYRPVITRLTSFHVGTIIMSEDAMDLKAVTVKADYARAYSDRTVYIPNNRQKNAAQNATELLRFMAIPQIRVTDNTVTDNTGGNVALFINGMAASEQELEGMRTADVRRVEYLEYPSDPRFRGARLAINFIVQEYAYGGYTKVTGAETFMVGLMNRQSVFSKFNYGRMSYDLYAATQNATGRHSGTTADEHYLLTRADGEETLVDRNEGITRSYFRKNVFPLTFRASYNTDRMQIRNTVGFTHVARHEYDLDGKVTIDGSQVSESKRTAPLKTNSASYSGDFYFSLPGDFSLDISPTFNYSHTDDRLKYSVDDADFVERNARENAYFLSGQAQARKMWGKRHAMTAELFYSLNYNRLRYSGTDSYDDKFMMQLGYSSVGYNYRDNKVAVYAEVGAAWESNYINGKGIDDLYPFTHVSFQYSPGKKHRLSAYIQYATSSPTLVHKASDILKDNEFLYISGNPDVKNARLYSFNLNYLWLATDWLSASVYGSYYECMDRLYPTYSPYDGGKAVIRSYANDGDYAKMQAGLSANLRLLDGKLSLNLRPAIHRYTSTGSNTSTVTHPTFQAEAQFFTGGFNFGAGFHYKDRYMMQDEFATVTTRNFHYLDLGWSNRNINVRLMILDIFNKGWKINEAVVGSRYYSARVTNFGSSSHPRLNLSVTYTIGYGKKIRRDNEIGQQGGASSAILK